MFIVNPLKGMNFAGLFSTHPPLEERIRRLRAMQPRSIY
jgi:heat shock protein HtpX